MTREEAIKILEEYLYSTGEVEGDTCAVVFDAGLDDTESAISMAIAALKEPPVVHGKWIHNTNNLYGCSECLGRETMSPKKLKPYCPNCGAHMKDGE